MILVIWEVNVFVLFRKFLLGMIFILCFFKILLYIVLMIFWSIFFFIGDKFNRFLVFFIVVI